MRYRSPGILSLARWSGRIPSILHEDRRTQDLPTIITISFTGLSPTLVVSSKNGSTMVLIRCWGPTTPQCEHRGLGWSVFARRYSRSRCSLSFPPVTKMFQFTGFPPLRVRVVHNAWVPPFGYPRINAYLQLPLAFRR
jgi:hypothetical protein